MSSRYFSNAAMILLGGLVVALSLGLTSTTALAWSAFGIAIGIVAVALFVQLDTGRGIAQRVLDGWTVAVAGTLIAVSVIFSGGIVMWLAFALALGVTGIGFIGLTLHEVESWRATHRLGDLHWLRPEVETTQDNSKSRVAA